MPYSMRSDFVIIRFREHLGDSRDDTFNDSENTIAGSSYPFMGDRSSIKTFNVEGKPGIGYLIIQSFNIDTTGIRILINDKNLPGEDIIKNTPMSNWTIWTDDIPPHFLMRGTNSIQIQRADNYDNFLVRDIVIHWRETD